MKITASQVKELRERTGVGMMECKKALQESDGDMEKAIESMRKSGIAKVAKKAERIAAEGIILIHVENQHASLLEVNCETDFVVRDEGFVTFAEQASQQALAHHINNVEQLASLTLPDGQSVEQARQALVAKIGENIQLRRVTHIISEGTIGHYRHGNRIGVIVCLKGGDPNLAKDIAMHIAAGKPQFITPDDVSADIIAKEKEILTAQAQASGKPTYIIEKMVSGRIKKFLHEISLTGQAFIKDLDITVGELLTKANAMVTQFVRYELGEGIEKKTGDFVGEVMAQLKSAS